MLSRWRASSPSRHTLMLCTHDMAEAELLCERFAILNDGVLLVRSVLLHFGAVAHVRGHANDALLLAG